MMLRIHFIVSFYCLNNNNIKINFNFNFIADKSRNQLLKGTKRPYTVDKERERRKGEMEKKENKWLHICKNNTMKKIKLFFHQFH